MYSLRVIVALLALSLPSSPSTKAANLDASAPEAPQLTQRSIDKVTIQNLKELPQFLLAPARTYQERFASDSNLEAAILFAACMIFVGASTAYVLAAAGKVELSSLFFVYVGTVVLWIFYAMLMHGLALLAGATRGIQFTISAYLYVVGSLQPVLAVLLAGLSRVFQKKVEYRAIETFGFSHVADVLAEGKFFSTSVTTAYRLISGTLIMVYFAIALMPAQHLSALSAASVAVGALFIFVVLGVTLFVVSKFLGYTTLLRLLIG